MTSSRAGFLRELSSAARREARRRSSNLTSDGDEDEDDVDIILGRGDDGDGMRTLDPHPVGTTPCSSRRAGGNRPMAAGDRPRTRTLSPVQVTRHVSGTRTSRSYHGATERRSRHDTDRRGVGSMKTPPKLRFAPRRFEEMRPLLAATTPLKLEGLMIDTFGDHNSPSFPTGWDGTEKKARRRNFPVDIRLSEMSLVELRRYAADKNIDGIDECRGRSEALDLIAIEFERQISQNRQGTRTRDKSVSRGAVRDGGARSSAESEGGSSAPGSMADTVKCIMDDGANLRSTLRTLCSKDLKLISDRLGLDRTRCKDKEELILMIEDSMPAVNGADRSVGSLRKSSSQHDEEHNPPRQHDRQQRRERDNGERPTMATMNGHSNVRRQQVRPEVKSSRGYKEDNSHLMPKREKGGSWHSYLVSSNEEGRVKRKGKYDTGYAEVSDLASRYSR